MPFFPPLKPKLSAALRDVSSSDARARAAAADALGSAPQDRRDDALEALRPLLDDSVSAVRAATLTSLGLLKDTESLDRVLARFEDGDATVRQIAVMVAAEIGDPKAAPALRRALRSERPEVRFQAAASLATLAPDEAATALPQRVDDDDPEVRAHLAEAMGSLEDPRCADALASLLDDRVKGVRQAAAIALGRLGDERAVPGLIDALRDDDRCFEAAWALGEMKATAAREPLAKVAQAFLKPLAVKAAAAAALVRIGDERGVPALRSVLTALRSDARSYAVTLVGELELAELAPEVAKLASRPRGADPLVVAEALGKLAPKSDAASQALRAMAGRTDEAGARARSLMKP